MKLARDVKRQTAGSLDRYAVLRQKVCVNADRALGKSAVTDKRRFDAEGGENGDEKAQRGTGFTAIDRDALGRRARCPCRLKSESPAEYTQAARRG